MHCFKFLSFITQIDSRSKMGEDTEIKTYRHLQLDSRVLLN